MECIVNINQGEKNLIELYIKHSQRKYNIPAVRQFYTTAKLPSRIISFQFNQPFIEFQYKAGSFW